VLFCVGRDLGAGLIPRPRSPTKYLKGSISKKKNPTPEKGIRKMRKKKISVVYLRNAHCSDEWKLKTCYV
jgi:hypothetical protein